MWSSRFHMGPIKDHLSLNLSAEPAMHAENSENLVLQVEKLFCCNNIKQLFDKDEP